MARTYTTTQGDMWDLIAHTKLGDTAHTDKLMNANQQYLGYYTFPAGIVLTLPEVPDDITDEAPPWKQVDDE
ncbi:MAG: tail protein X [Oscillospiraceae bacterium]|nr:tail protein X [Oscillospiraceae bacterium]